MAVTAIKYVFNQSPSLRLEVVNNRNGETSGGSIPPGGGRSMNTWVPWCWSQQMFNAGERIQARLIRQGQEDIVFAIWQQAGSDGDFVRSTRSFEDPLFADSSPLSQAGGDKILFVTDDSIRLDEIGVNPAVATQISSNETEYFATSRTKSD